MGTVLADPTLCQGSPGGAISSRAAGVRYGDSSDDRLRDIERRCYRMRVAGYSWALIGAQFWPGLDDDWCALRASSAASRYAVRAARRWPLGEVPAADRDAAVELLDLLGTVPDIEAARRTGRSSSSIQRLRVRCGITSWRAQSRSEPDA